MTVAKQLESLVDALQTLHGHFDKASGTVTTIVTKKDVEAAKSALAAAPELLRRVQEMEEGCSGAGSLIEKLEVVSTEVLKNIIVSAGSDPICETERMVPVEKAVAILLQHEAENVERVLKEIKDTLDSPTFLDPVANCKNLTKCIQRIEKLIKGDASTRKDEAVHNGGMNDMVNSPRRKYPDSDLLVDWLPILDRTTRCLAAVLASQPVRDADEVLSESRLFVMDALMKPPMREAGLPLEAQKKLTRPLNCLVGYCDSVDALPSELKAWGEQLKCLAGDLSDAWDSLTTDIEGEKP